MPDLPPLADNVFDIYRSMVMPAQCDHYGHMNVRWYAHHFDEAGFQIWTVAGVSQGEMRERGIKHDVHGNDTKGSVYFRDPDDILLEITTGY